MFPEISIFDMARKICNICILATYIASEIIFPMQYRFYFQGRCTSFYFYNIFLTRLIYSISWHTSWISKRGSTKDLNCIVFMIYLHVCRRAQHSLIRLVRGKVMPCFLNSLVYTIMKVENELLINLSYKNIA